MPQAAVPLYFQSRLGRYGNQRCWTRVRPERRTAAHLAKEWLPTKEQHLRPGDTISGPALVWLADLSFYLLLMGRLGPVAAAVTTNLTINFMRKPEPADLLGEGRLMKLGRALAVGDFTIWSEGEQEPVAHATLTYSLPRTAKKG